MGAREWRGMGVQDRLWGETEERAVRVNGSAADGAWGGVEGRL